MQTIAQMIDEMKRLFCMVCIGITPFMAAGCTRSIDPSGPDSIPADVVKISALNGAVTRTALGELKDGKYPVPWSEDDVISVNGNASTSIEIDKDNPSLAQFSLSGVLNPPYCAVYPASATGSYDASAGTVAITLPSEQEYMEGSFDPSSAVMLGYGLSGVMSFRHAVAFLKITAGGGSSESAIRSVKVSSVAREAMSGPFTAVFSEDGCTMASDSPERTPVTLTSNAGVPQGEPMYIAIPAQTYTKGICMQLKDAEGHLQFYLSSKSFTAAAGYVYNTSVAFDGDGSWVGVAIDGAGLEDDAFGFEFGSFDMSMADALISEPPVIESVVESRYLHENMGKFLMTVGIAYVPDTSNPGHGRIWNCVVGGGDNKNAYFLLNWSDDGGDTWTDTRFVVDSHKGCPMIDRRTIVGNIWTAPDGKLWLFMDESLTYFDGKSSNWCAVCENPLDPQPEWSEVRYIGFGCSLQLPTVMSTGEWVLPVSLWDRKRITDNRFKNANHDLDPYRGAHCFVSEDRGATWEDRSFLNTATPRFDEHCFVEMTRDGQKVWWITARSQSNGIEQAFSFDRGYSWKADTSAAAASVSVMTPFQNHTSSRHLMRRVNESTILFVRHGSQGESVGRKYLTAYVSQDDGRNWSGGLVLDDRTEYSMSYPCAVVLENGDILLSYDYGRDNPEGGELYLARFSVDDVLNGSVTSEKGFLRKLIFKAGQK